MRRVFAAAVVGMLAGVTAAAGVLVIAFGETSIDMGRGVRSGVLPLTLGFAGPGAILLGLPLAAFLRRRLQRGRSRGRVLLLGCLAGPLLGLLNLALALWLPLGTEDALALFTFSAPQSPALLGAAFAGSAALGLGCAWWVSRPPKEPA